MKSDIAYWGDDPPNDHAAEVCRLDLWAPPGEASATIVHFHGGGMEGGEREVPECLKAAGFAVATADYRLTPRATTPQFVEDAAAATAWVMKNVSQRVVLVGISAGAYLAAMITLDRRWLTAHDATPDDIVGLASLSGQMITHFAIRRERGIAGEQAVVDDLAPLYHVRADAPPMLLMTGDRELELLGRYEETAYMRRMMLVAGHRDCELIEMPGYDHGGMVEPSWPMVIQSICRWTS